MVFWKRGAPAGSGVGSLVRRLAGVALLTLAGAALAGPAPADEGYKPNDIDHAMRAYSGVRDAAACAMSVEDGRILVDPAISNPAMSCPDMFSWKLFAEAVQQEFWKHWAADEQTWPAEPYALCGAGEDPAVCCTPGANDNPGYDDADNPALHCPYFPGEATAAGGAPPRRAQPLSKAHSTHFHHALRRVTPQEIDALDPGRILRQSMAEVVFRNRPLFDYVFEHNLYNREGLAAVFAEAARVMSADAPYRSANAGGASARIDFPIDAVMIKSNWMHRDRAEALGIEEDPQAPFVKMTLTSAVTDNNAQIFEPGEHWLLAFHLSSKDIPNWVWLTFEHVHNLGRCDYTGCNDSYGYRSADATPAGSADNFTRPHTMADELPISSPVFDPGRVYPDGEIRAGLDALLSGLGIGGGAAGDPAMPSAADPAWRSYRLKGSQVGFVQSDGWRNLLGNSVTEGGFVSSSSCMTCHARAHVGSDGFPSVLGVFENDVDTIGYGRGPVGVPDPNWFFTSQQPPALQALQTDFVWGFFFAKALHQAKD